MSFRKLRGVHLPYAKQMLIRATCLNYADRPKWEQGKIERLCAECGGEYCAALREVMLTERSIRSIAEKHHVGESTLYEIRKRFYECW